MSFSPRLILPLCSFLALTLVAGDPPKSAVPAVKTAVRSKGSKATTPAALPAPLRVTSVEGITEYRLANGLRVLLFPDDSQPTQTVNITYLVGSRHESYGETGMAHLLEHLLFKPSANFGGRAGTSTPTEVLNSVGATFNGSTRYDRTNYFVTFPASEANLAKILDLEADRMVHALIRQSDLWNEKEQKGEMSVVRNEFEIGQNDPVSVTTERMESVAFDWHNYGKSTIGARSDIEHVNIEHLQAFYRKYYQPDNAILLVAGKIDEAKTLGMISARFGVLPKPTRVIERTWTEEPTQDGERSVTVRRVGGTPFLAAGYHIAATSHLDNLATALVARTLTAAPSGRLYKALVEQKLASQVFNQAVSTLEPSFQEFGAILPADADVEKVKQVFIKTLEGFKEQAITQVELDRAKAEMAKAFQLTSSRTDRLAIGLSEAMAAGDWRLYFLGRDRTKALTLAQVQTAAEKYLKSSNRTLAIYIPTEKPERTEIPAALDIASMVKDYRGQAALAQGETFDPGCVNVDQRTQLFTSPNGMKGALLEKRTKGALASVTLTLRFGSEQSLQNLGAVPELTAAMLMRGSKSHSREQITDELDRLKAQIGIHGGATQLNASLTVPRENLEAALRLVAEILRQPVFPETELETLRQQQITNIEKNMTEPQSLAVTALRKRFNPYPKGHPSYISGPTEHIADLKVASRANLQAFHQAFYGAQSATFAAVGDFDSKVLQGLVTSLFGDWKAAQGFVRIPARLSSIDGGKQVIETPDKANAMFLAFEAFPMKDGDPDFPAMLMADYILGGGALKSRLADRIRQKEGLSYGVGTSLTVSPLDPVAGWVTYAFHAPLNRDRVEAAFKEEMILALDKGFTLAEVDAARTSWLQGEEVARSNDGALAGLLAQNLYLGRSMAFQGDLERRVKILKPAEVDTALRRHLSMNRIGIIQAGDFAKAEKK